LRTPILAAGIVVLLIGLGIWAFAAYTPSPNQTSTTTNTTTLIPPASRNIDGNGDWSFGTSLLQGERVTGTATIQNYNGSAGPAFFYVMNESLFIDWGGCAPCKEPTKSMGSIHQGTFENNTIPSTGTLSFAWTAPSTGGYYFVFDDSAYGAAAPATLSASGVVSLAVTTSSPYANGHLPLIGAVIALIGIIVSAISLVISDRSSRTPTPPAMAATT
jgi:hypothetical protein